MISKHTYNIKKEPFNNTYYTPEGFYLYGLNKRQY